MNKSTMVYLAYKFTGNPTENTKQERKMAYELMKRHPDWTVLCPHYAIDSMLDGTVNWDGKDNYTKWRRLQAGEMSLGFIDKTDILVLGCEPCYQQSAGVTWEYIFTKFLNKSYRKDNPIKIMTYKEALE